MMKNQVFVARALALLAGVALLGVFYLVLFVPVKVRVWKDYAALSGTQQTLAKLSNFCQVTGWFLVPALLLAVVGCGVWAVLAGARAKTRSANQPSQPIAGKPGSG